MNSTRFLDAACVAQLIQREGLAPSLQAIANNIREDFLRWPQFDKSARVASHSPVGVIELMPVADARTYAFKYVNGHPDNWQHGLPTVMAFGILADVATGYPLLLSELTLATALRTAAMSALAASSLARADSRTMAVIGNGAQSEFQILAFHYLNGIQHFRLFDVDPAATQKLCRHLDRLSLTYTVCASTADAVVGADIITTITADKTRATILTSDMIAPGTHINAVGGDCPGKTELDAAILQMGEVFCEYAPQSRIEGELQQMAPDFPATELWQVLAGQARGRRDAAHITIFDSVGFAIEDLSALRFLLGAAEQHGLGRSIDLVPRLSDPRDLFGTLQAPAIARPAAPILSAA